MKLQQSWYNKTKWCYCLLPLSLLYYLIDRLNRFFTLNRQTLSPPVIVIGNIVAGGSGKSLMVVWLAKQLVEWGYKPGIISRGYGTDTTDVVEVNAQSNPAVVGDEPLMLHLQTQVPVVVARKRFLAYQHLVKQHRVDIVISDDGLQHYALPRQAEIILIDGERGFGNGFLLPAGPKREPISRLKSADLVLAKAQPHELADGYFQLKPSIITALNHQQPAPQAGDKVVALCAIANPDSFVATLESLGFEVELHAFADHYAISSDDVRAINAKFIVVTAKDAVKLHAVKSNNLYVLPVEIELELPQIQHIQALAKRLIHG